jgi:D-alanyl-lipoteichoic acid acyltransferase DltB (MBOAT superfamily)
LLFTSVKYGVFLVAVFVAYWSLARARLGRLLFLLGASYFFYANWRAECVLLLWFSSSLDFLVGGALPRLRTPGRKRALLAFSLSVNLAILALFKYANFFIGAASDFVVALGLDPLRLHVGLALPIGISFYTFKTMSYVIDVYRGRLAPTSRYHEYLLYVSFFPQLAAGPIARATELLPQFADPPSLADDQGSRALWLIMTGLFKKVVIADYLGLMLVDRVFSIPEMYTSWEALAAVYGYALQIYCDFSGYSDVAIGSALLLGFRVSDNFNAPYRATNLRDFWRRWHISLSTWFRDYLYIPLGGSRGGPARTYFNLCATMLLCGLWHGAEWKFLFWGALHAGGQTLTRIIQRAAGRDNAATRAGRLLTGFVTFQFVCFAWIFFRADDVGAGFNVLRVLAAGIGGAPNLPWPALGLLVLGYALHWLPPRWATPARDRFAALPAPVQGLVLFGAVAVLYAVASSDIRPYIYSQF